MKGSKTREMENIVILFVREMYNGVSTHAPPESNLNMYEVVFQRGASR